MFRLFVLFVFLFLNTCCNADSGRFSESRKTVCLNMVVKNESDVIEACLNSVKPLIDYWVICDLGSTDGTQEIVKRCMRDIPGEFHESFYEDLTQNRNVALNLAKARADYTLLIDAYEVLEYREKFKWPQIDKDFYFIKTTPLWEGESFERIALIDNQFDWKWEGVGYEMLTSSQAMTFAFLKDVTNLCNTTVKERFKTTFLLEKTFAKDPINSFHPLHLGLEYFKEGQFQLAKTFFEQSITLSQDPQLTYAAMYHLGLVQEKLGDFESALKIYMQAHVARPARAEPLFRIAMIHRQRGDYLLGYLVAKQALAIPYPNLDDLFVDHAMYDHALRIEFANCALLLGKWSEGLEACYTLLANPNLPEEYKSRILSNAQLASNNLYRS